MKKHRIMNNQFLKDFAEKFGKDIIEKENIMRCDSFCIDYHDSTGALFYKNSYDDEWAYYYSIGDNGCIFNCEDYRFFWDNLLSKNEEFTEWMKSHNITENDLMTIEGDIYDNSIDFHAGFWFYGKED